MHIRKSSYEVVDRADVIGAGFSSAVQYLHNDDDFRHKYLYPSGIGRRVAICRRPSA
jgi:hypothetical protein